MIRGGDIAAIGDDVSLNWFERDLGEKQEVKVRARLGPARTDARAVRILDRIAEWRPGGIH